MASNCVRYGACTLLAAAAVLTGCSTGSSSMVNAVSPTTTASISATSYDFGQNLVGNPETQTVVEVTNTGSNPLNLNPTIVGSTPGFTVVTAQSCGTTLAAASSCPIVITYDPTAAGSQSATLNLGLANVPLPLAPGLVALDRNLGCDDSRHRDRHQQSAGRALYDYASIPWHCHGQLWPHHQLRQTDLVSCHSQRRWSGQH